MQYRDPHIAAHLPIRELSPADQPNIFIYDSRCHICWYTFVLWLIVISGGVSHALWLYHS
jgi:hypothetical protein